MGAARYGGSRLTREPARSAPASRAVQAGSRPGQRVADRSNGLREADCNRLGARPGRSAGTDFAGPVLCLQPPARHSDSASRAPGVWRQARCDQEVLVQAIKSGLDHSLVSCTDQKSLARTKSVATYGWCDLRTQPLTARRSGSPMAVPDHEEVWRRWSALIDIQAANVAVTFHSANDKHLSCLRFASAAPHGRTHQYQPATGPHRSQPLHRSVHKLDACTSVPESAPRTRPAEQQ